MCQSCVSIHNFFYSVPPNKRSPQPQDKVGNQVVRLGILKGATSGPGSRSCGAGSWAGGTPPPTPQPSIISQGAASCQVFLEKYFFFFFFFFFFFIIFPLLLYHVLVAFVKYFSKTFLKKFFIFLLTFAF
jgi:hypothetical protein